MSLVRLDTAKRVGDQAYEAIYDAILSGELPPGRRLQIRELAGLLGISVMPVREAIKRLEEQGLVVTAPYRGAEVKRFSAEELLDLYAVRRLLEVEAAATGASLVTAQQIAEMRDAYQRMVDALADVRVIDYLNEDERLLTVLYAASGNPVLMEVISSLWDRCRTYKIVGVRLELESGTEPLLEHQARLIEAVVNRDAHLAGVVTAASLDAASDRIRVAMPRFTDLLKDQHRPEPGGAAAL